FADERPVAAWAAMAVGALTKGPIAVAIPLLALGSHALATGTPVHRLFSRRGLALFGAIALPWFIVVSIEHPDFPGYVFLRETLQRVTTRSFHRTAPFWYYLPILPLAGFPWIVPALARLTRWLPAPISLTPAEKAAIPPAAVALGIVVLCSGVLVGLGALTRRPRSTFFGYAVVVMAIPFLSGRLLVAVGDDRSSAGVARATAAALERSGGTGTVLGVLAYPPSLPFYLGRPIAVATETGRELTSNYIADN